MYFWFPLLAGLSELTFDPRPDIRYSALEVLFDTLKFHGAAFTLPFWTRIFDSVLLPIFDHVRAEVRGCMGLMLSALHSCYLQGFALVFMHTFLISHFCALFDLSVFNDVPCISILCSCQTNMLWLDWIISQWYECDLRQCMYAGD